MVMWVRCTFSIRTSTVQTLAVSVCCVLEQDTKSALLQSNRITNDQTEHPREECLFNAMSFLCLLNQRC